MTHRYGRRTRADRDQPRVLEAASGLRHESGPRREASWAPDRVAVMAHWSADPVPSRSVLTQLHELSAGGYETVLVSAAELDAPLARVGGAGDLAMPATTTVLRRQNVGYDFGS